MSAEKCGEVLINTAQEGFNDVKLMKLSTKAFRMLNKIRNRFPDFEPNTEYDIFVKARKMGLLDEQD